MLFSKLGLFKTSGCIKWEFRYIYSNVKNNEYSFMVIIENSSLYVRKTKTYRDNASLYLLGRASLKCKFPPLLRLMSFLSIFDRFLTFPYLYSIHYDLKRSSFSLFILNIFQRSSSIVLGKIFPYLFFWVFYLFSQGNLWFIRLWFEVFKQC